jgi:acetyl-CoA synthetase
MIDKIQRFLNPKNIALIGGNWTDSIIEANQKMGYQGSIWRVNPNREGFYKSVEELPSSPDAAFIVVPNHAVTPVVNSLNNIDAGGYVCFSAGFGELQTKEGDKLEEDLLQASKGLPFLGPNCYGYINYFDRVSLWPEKVSSNKPEKGVAIISQSGGLCQCFIHNQRSLPIGYVISIGNQAGLTIEDLMEFLISDERVTAFGIYAEEIKDFERFSYLVQLSNSKNKPIAILKAGASIFSKFMAPLHTDSNTGDDAKFNIFCKNYGIARCETFSIFMETLKVLHMCGSLAGNKILLCAGSAGYVLMTGDVSRNIDLNFADISKSSEDKLKQILGPRVVISNPLDFQTRVWAHEDEFISMLQALFESNFDVIVLMLSYPPLFEKENTTGYDTPIDRLIKVSKQYTNTKAAILCGLPEFWNKEVRERCMENGVIPLQGHFEGLTALSLAANLKK